MSWRGSKIDRQSNEKGEAVHEKTFTVMDDRSQLPVTRHCKVGEY